MGYKHSYDLIAAYQQIRAAVRECADPRNDGFITWGIKQDLYNLKNLLDTAIKDCPSFGDTEAEWLREQEKKKVIGYLKNDIQ